MSRLLSNNKDILSSKSIKKYNRRELLAHLAEVKKQLDIVEQYIQGCRTAFAHSKNGQTDDWREFEINKDRKQYPTSHAYYQHYLARIGYIERRLQYILR